MSSSERSLYQESGASRRRWEDRRQGGDRRSGVDRRGSGARHPLSVEPRPYGFREFTERRNSQDRRIYSRNGEAWDRRNGDCIGRGDHEALSSLLTMEEIRYLLRGGRRGRR